MPPDALHNPAAAALDWTGVLMLAVFALAAVVVLLAVMLTDQRREHDRAVAATLDGLAANVGRLERELTGVLARLAALERRRVDDDEPWSRPWEDREQ